MVRWSFAGLETSAEIFSEFVEVFRQPRVFPYQAREKGPCCAFGGWSHAAIGESARC